MGSVLANTFPMYWSPMGALVYQTQTQRGIWNFMHPLSLDLWLSILAAIAAVTLAVFAVRLAWPGSEVPYRQASAHGLLHAFYESIAILVGGEDWEHQMQT